MRSVLFRKKNVSGSGSGSHVDFLTWLRIWLSWLVRSKILILIIVPFVTILTTVLVIGIDHGRSSLSSGNDVEATESELEVMHGKLAEDGSGVWMHIPKCGCLKKIPHPLKSDDGVNDLFKSPIKVNHTTCSQETFVRGLGQKIVAFSFWENDPKANHVSF